MKKALFIFVLCAVVAVAAVRLEQRESKRSGAFRIQPLELPENHAARAAPGSALLSDWDAYDEPQSAAGH